MSVTQTTPLLEQQRREEQEALAARHNGTAAKAPKSFWVIDKLRPWLPPHQVGLAIRLCDLKATADGINVAGSEAIDGGGNGRDIAMGYRCDALRALHGYEAAVRANIDAKAARCFWGIVQGDAYNDVARAVGYGDGRGSYRSKFKQLVQLVMIAAQDYDDAINTVQPLEKCA